MIITSISKKWMEIHMMQNINCRKIYFGRLRIIYQLQIFRLIHNTENKFQEREIMQRNRILTVKTFTKIYSRYYKSYSDLYRIIYKIIKPTHTNIEMYRKS